MTGVEFKTLSSEDFVPFEAFSSSVMALACSTSTLSLGLSLSLPMPALLLLPVVFFSPMGASVSVLVFDDPEST